MLFLTRRFFSTFRAIVYETHGQPCDVLRVQSIPLTSRLSPDSSDEGKVDEKDALVIKILASPINPSDINQIQGVYPLKPQLPAIGGNECVAEVVNVGTNLRERWKEGDWVIPIDPGFGTWRTFALANETQVVKVPKSLSAEDAAMVSVNPFSAYRMIKDFGNLKQGDYIVQNAANSAVGQLVIQMAKILGFKSINIIRQRPDFDEVKNYLSSLGADMVLADDAFKLPEIRAKLKDLQPRLKLGLNCVGGRSVTDLARNLAPRSPVVTYGNLSKQPMSLPASLFIFQDLQFCGFWMSRWKQTMWRTEKGRQAYQNMLDDIVNWYATKQLLSVRYEKIKWTGSHGDEKVKEAFDKAQKEYYGRKILLDMTE